MWENEMNCGPMFLNEQLIADYAAPLSLCRTEEYIDFKPMYLNTNAGAEFECSISNVNECLFKQLNVSHTPNNFTIIGFVPVTVAARLYCKL